MNDIKDAELKAAEVIKAAEEQSRQILGEANSKKEFLLEQNASGIKLDMINAKRQAEETVEHILATKAKSLEKIVATLDEEFDGKKENIKNLIIEHILTIS